MQVLRERHPSLLLRSVPYWALEERMLRKFGQTK